MRTTLLLLLMISSMMLSAQVVSGLYSGTLTNDSTRAEQRYELALSEYRGKITGYSYTTFVSNDTFYYGVKRVKATRKGDQLIVEDDKMIVNNFPESPAKGVKQTNTIDLPPVDTLRNANGNWQTNRTRIYYSLTGNVSLQLDNDSSRSALIGHLKELNIISQPKYASTRLPSGKNEKDRQEQSSQSSTKVSADPEDDDVTASVHRPAGKPVKEIRSGSISRKEDAGVAVRQASAIPVREHYSQRNKKTLEAIEFSSDSVILSFYDNGVIDGDSISVYVNGENVISHNKLTAVATKVTVKMPDSELVEIILVAENLGTIPPNTGLLVVRDGEKTYQLNFSADLQTNAAIIFKRKQK